MALALVIGYVFARQGQQLSVQDNLATAAQKTAQGTQLALEGRLDMARRIAQSGEVRQVLRVMQTAPNPAMVAETMLNGLSVAADRAGAEVHFQLFDVEGNYLAGTRELGQDDPSPDPDWHKTLNGTTFTNFHFGEDTVHHSVVITSPIYDDNGADLLGFLSETQSVEDLLLFILGQDGIEQPGSGGKVYYEVVYRQLDGKYVSFYLHRDEPNGGVVTKYQDLDPDLAAVMEQSRAKEEGRYSLWNFDTRGQSIPALLAYHRMRPGNNLHVLVYRSASEAYANINLAALLTLAVSSLVILLFCIIAYRNVNNNIIRPVSLLNEGAQIIRQGDLDLKLKIGTGDEIEELAMSFNKMATALSQNISQLEGSEERYRSLITAMRDGIFQTNPEGMITLINPAGLEILGFVEEKEVIGANIRGLFIEQMDYARVTSDLEKHRFVERTRVWMKKKRSHPICVELSINRVFGEDGQQIGVEGTFRDVTQNVRLEQEARERSERIGAINQIANAINSSLEAGRVYESIVVEVKKLIDFNYAAIALLKNDGKGFETRQLWPELRRAQGSSMRMDDEESCAGWVARENQCLIVDDLQTGDSPFAGQFPRDIRSCLCVPLFATGRIIGTLNLGSEEKGAFGKHEVEISEQMAPHMAVAIRNARLLENLQHSLEEVTRAREKLHEANEELKSLDEMKTNLLSNVSHELRTPLVAVMGYTDMILNGKVGPINEVQREYLGISLRNIDKLVTLIENLLDFSRLHRGAEEIVFDTLDLADCVRTSMQIVQPVADSRGIALVLDAPEEPVLVEGDKGKLGQVFNNLLSNAVKFNEKGGSVTVRLRLLDNNVEVSVSDTGIGIPEEALDKIFTRFYQYDGSSTRKYGGTGIGLSIAQDIMRLHGSSITVSSTVGKGTVFRFVLVLSGAQQGSADSRENNLPIPTETHLLIELVTQDRALSGQIRNLLLSEGMDVIHAAYPSAAISLAEKYSPDCILVDSEAGPLGSVVIEEILSDPISTSVPIILLTNDDGLYQRFRDNIAGRVQRGFRKSTLLSGIHYALSRGVPAGEQLGNKVLCVDDDVEIVRFISRCLQAEGYDTESASTGEEALEKVQTGEYWLVLLDIAMPGMDGWETCRQLKTNAALAGLKIYMVTAKPIDNSMIKINECGADGYLMKPFKPEDLVHIVQSLRARQMT
ncbi:MAG: response regulator [Candidatus Hydrogenedentes bacterium]|nr:response regulator [Candidatus Hydrogenedentota bacterium]